MSNLVYRLLSKVKHRPSCVSIQSFSSERDVEWPFCAAHIPAGPGLALDFGCGASSLGFLAALHGFQVTAIDLEAVNWLYRHPNLRFIQGNLFELNLPQQQFDLVINCSSVEHVGLKGRYGIKTDHQNGDLEAMAFLGGLMKTQGMMLLTIPLGEDTVFVPLHRIYGRQRLPRLLEHFMVEHEEYWLRNETNCWELCTKERALSFQASGNLTEPTSFKNALGCFVLRRGTQEI